MTHYERNALFLSVAIAVAGIFAAFHFGAGHYFARSGSLITVVAIVFASLDLRKRLANAPSFVEEQLGKNRNAILQQGRDQGLDEAKCAELFEKVSSETRKDVQDVVKTASNRVLRVELAIFIAGTIIWGFGDLPIDALLKKACGVS